MFVKGCFFHISMNHKLYSSQRAARDPIASAEPLRPDKELT